MRICINSRNLDGRQQAKVEAYFYENFSFDDKVPQLIWKEDASDFILLGYRTGEEHELGEVTHDFRTVMCRVHENELMGIAGRKFLDDAVM